MPKSFSAQVEAWARQSSNRLDAIFKTAVQNMAIEANTDATKGGRLPKDTGFLQNSFGAALNGDVYGPSDARFDPAGNSDDVLLVIAQAQIGDSITLGWSANYSRVQNAKNGFRDAAAQKWPQFVRMATIEAKATIR